MSNIHCSVSNCKITLFNKPPGVTFHSCPSNHDLRNKWLQMLKNKCSVLDWSRSKICSRHFENKYFDSQRKLKENAVPTLFAIHSAARILNTNKSIATPKTKVDKMLSNLTQAEITQDVKNDMGKMKEPTNLDVFVTDDLKCKNEAPMEARLWLMIKKQQYLIVKLMEQSSYNKKHIEFLQKNLEDSRASKKEVEQNIDSLKYVVKCLQEKHATLEEQIEILTAVESR